MAFTSGECKDRGTNKGKPKRERVALPGKRFEMEQHAQAGAESRDLGQRKVHEDDFAPDDMEPEINENPRQEEARNQRPCHYFKCNHNKVEAERSAAVSKTSRSR